MKKQEKLQLLRKFKEKSMINNVIIPLLEKMGFKNITVTHGSLEKGKDLLFYKENEFEEREYTGIQVKAVDIHGRAGEKWNATEILNQAQQAFTHDFQDTYDNKTKNIDRYIVMTSGNITETAKESIGDQLKAVGCYKTIQFFDGNKLVDLVDKWIPDFFWEEYNFFNRYFREMKKDFETIKDISAIGQKEAVNLEDIYVSLKLSETAHERDLPVEMEKGQIEEKIFDEKVMVLIEQRKELEVKREWVIEPEKALKQFHRLVIVGAPGAGKTTLLKHLALKYCMENIEKQERTIVPIPITLRDFFQSGKGLRKYIDVVFDKYGFPEARKFVEKDLKAGKCILLLDGFDELASRENQEKVTKEVHNFVNQYYGSRVVVTSRIAGYHDELSGFTRLEVLEFDDSQIKQFINNWFGEADRNKAQSMLKAVMGNENIKTLARNPLMVAIIAIIYEEDRELPQRRADLYKRAVDVMLSRWDLRKKLKNRFKTDQKEFILRKLAFRFHCRNLRVMKETEILEEIGKYSSRIGLKEDQTKPFLEEIWQRSYLLRQIAMETYDFLHLSFQEYFTALELKEQEDGIGTIISHLNESWWEEPVLLYTGICKDAEPLIKRIQKEVSEDIFYSNLVLSGKCIADAEFTESNMKDDIAQVLWWLYQDGGSTLLRERTMDVLRRMKPRGIIDYLIKQLNDKELLVRGRAVFTLGAIGSIGAVPSLIKVLTSDKHSYVRLNAASALGVIGDNKAVPSLIKALTSDKHSSVRRSAANALGAIGSSEAVPFLLKALNSDKDSEVRGSAASALGALGGSEAIPSLIKIIKSDLGISVYWRAAEALRTIGSSEAVLELLNTLTSDKKWYIRQRAADALGAIGSSEAVPSLIKTLTSDEDSEVRDSAASALGAIGSSEAVPLLLKAFTSNKDTYYWSHIPALGAIGGSEAVPSLIKALTSDENSLVRGSAASALGAIGSSKAVPSLIKALTSDENSLVRGSAASALGAIGSSKAVPSLTKALTSDEDSEVRWRVASALGIIGSSNVVPSLLKTLISDKDSFVRGSAADALGKIGNEIAIQPLRQALEDEGKHITGLKVKDAAFEALYKISRRLGVRILPDDRRRKTEDGRRITVIQ